MVATVKEEMKMLNTEQQETEGKLRDKMNRLLAVASDFALSGKLMDDSALLSNHSPAGEGENK